MVWGYGNPICAKTQHILCRSFTTYCEGRDIPIPKSKWWENSFVLLDKNHNPHIFQSSPLSYWEDGSIKWVLIEFLSNIKPNTEKTFFLSHTNTSLPYKNDSICVEAQDSVILNNGKVKLELSSSNSPKDVGAY